MSRVDLIALASFPASVVKLLSCPRTGLQDSVCISLHIQIRVCKCETFWCAQTLRLAKYTGSHVFSAITNLFPHLSLAF